jgi:hypothetical protein
MSRLFWSRNTEGENGRAGIHLAAAGYPLLGDPLYGLGGLPKPEVVAAAARAHAAAAAAATLSAQPDTDTACGGASYGMAPLHHRRLPHRCLFGCIVI